MLLSSISSRLNTCFLALVLALVLTLRTDAIPVRTSPAQIAILEQLYLKTSGGQWNYARQRQALIELGETGFLGVPWDFTKNSGGEYTVDPCPLAAGENFQGVNCASCASDALPGTCNVTNLRLLALNMVGPLPGELGGLTGLNNIFMNNNHLTGTIPDALSSLTSLQGFSVLNNSMTGTLPPWFGTFKNLDSLWLHGNRFYGTLPKEYGNLGNMLALTLSKNDVMGTIPASYCNLGSASSSLQILYLFNNFLQGTIPECIGELVNIQQLILNNNELTGTIPGQLVKTNLTKLFLQSNNFTGTLPAEILDMPSLRYLNVEHNSLTGTISPMLGHSTGLQQVILADNRFGGTLPTTISTMSTLQELVVKGNRFESSAADNFNFINATRQTNLTWLDISENGFTGMISAKVFELTALQIFAAAGNCFRGSLPANICNASQITTLVMSGLSSGEPCRRYFFEGSALRRVFDGFTATTFIEGTLPHCLLNLPQLQTLAIGGNKLSGSLPERISPSLNTIDLSRSHLKGTIPAALTDSRNLTKLDLSYNSITGSLDVFARQTSRFYSDKNMVLNLDTNRLSGNIPTSLASMKNISILTGNVFYCSLSRKELPPNDPNVNTYQCGSSDLTEMLFVFLGITSFVTGLIYYVWKGLNTFRIRGEISLWLDVADGRRRLDDRISTQHIKRYSDHLRDLRWFALIIGIVMLFVMIVYISLSDDGNRTIVHPYAWISTAAYLTGPTSTLWLFLSGCAVVLTSWYLITQNIRGGLGIAASYKADAAEEENVAETLERRETLARRVSQVVLPLLRLLLVICFIWGAIIAANVVYVYVLLYGSTFEQVVFKAIFAVFKLVWSMTVTPVMFEYEFLYLGVSAEHHEAIIRRILGGKVTRLLIMNVVSMFFIPIFTIAVVDPNCFFNVFSSALETSISYGNEGCLVEFESGVCFQYAENTQSIAIPTPFVYTHTCTASLLRFYVPLYELMSILLITRSSIQMVYLCWEIRDAEKPPRAGDEERDANPGFFAKMFLITVMPVRHLLYSNSYRRRIHTPEAESVYALKDKLRISKSIANHLWNLLILLTFGLLAPPLAGMIIVSIVMETFATQMVLGRFLVAEFGVVLEHTRLTEYARELPFKPEKLFISSERRARMGEATQDALKPWGAFASLREIEMQCKAIPQSLLSVAQVAFVLIPLSVLAVMISDVLKSYAAAANDFFLWVWIMLPCIAIILMVLTCVYGSDRTFVENKGPMHEMGALKTPLVERDDIELLSNPIHALGFYS